MTRNTKIAIVILNWNGVKLFPEFLPSLIEHSQGKDIELIIADNGSTDKSIAYILKKHPTIRLLDLETNYGFAKGYNVALEQIEAEYFILVNSDVKVTKGWIEPCVKLLDSDKNIAAVQPKILAYKEPDTFEYAGAAGGFIDKFGYPFCRGRMLDRVEKDKGQYDQRGDIFWATGACMFVRADVFKAAGGFDPLFWAHMEEIDLCWRLKNQGYRIVYEPLSVIYHLGGGSLEYGNPRKVYLNFRNNLFMLYKNLPRHEFKRIMFIRMILDGIAAAKFLIGLEWKAFKAVARAHTSFYMNLGQVRKKRKELQSKVIKVDHEEIYRQSIMWKFFIQKKYTFAELNFNPEKK